MFGAACLPFARRDAAWSADDTAGIIARAKAKTLESSKVVERAREKKLFDPAGQSCEVIDRLLMVDKQALDEELANLKKLRSVNSEQVAEVKAVTNQIEKQVKYLAQAENKAGCVDSFITYDTESILSRARSANLNVDRAVQRAKTGQMVDAKYLAKYSRCGEIKELAQIDLRALGKQTMEIDARKKAGKSIEDESRVNIALKKQVDSLVLYQQICNGELDMTGM